MKRSVCNSHETQEMEPELFQGVFPGICLGGFSRFGGALCWRAEVKRIHMRRLICFFPVLMFFLRGSSRFEAGPGGGIARLIC